MINNEIEIQSHLWEDVPPGVISLRKQVFMEEQQVPVELEFDEMDEQAVHFSATMNNDTQTIAACARLYRSNSENTQGIIGRMAVLAPYRKQGIAKKLITVLIQYGIEKLNITSFRLSAQLTAVPFYQSVGFIPCDEVFIDAGIEHRDMYLHSPNQLLKILNQNQPLPTSPFGTGKDDTTWHFDDEQSCLELTKSALLQAQKKIDIYSHDLEHDLYNNPMVVRMISQFSRHNPNSHVRILITDERLIIKRHHELVTLAQRLPSKIELKIIDGEYRSQTSAFCLIDRYSLIYRRNHDSHEGFCNFKAAGRVRILRDDFETMWRRSSKSRELSTLGL